MFKVTIHHHAFSNYLNLIPFLSECSVHSGLQTKDVPFIQACISFSVNVPVHSGLQTKDGGGPLLVEGSSAISQVFELISTLSDLCETFNEFMSKSSHPFSKLSETIGYVKFLLSVCYFFS